MKSLIYIHLTKDKIKIKIKINCLSFAKSLFHATRAHYEHIMNDYERLWTIMNDYERLWTIMNDYERLWTHYERGQG